MMKLMCGGRSKTASVTATLAIGGQRLEDIDPATQNASVAPLVTIAAALWDKRVDETTFARTWQHWRAKLAMQGFSWGSIAGPFGAAQLSMERIGAVWKSPFVIEFLFGEVDLREIPPKQVAALAREQARVALDQELIVRIVGEVGEQGRKREVLDEYRYGIDWPTVRHQIGAMRK
jgi:hypothetical protein